jgi:hypothetical protein
MDRGYLLSFKGLAELCKHACCAIFRLHSLLHEMQLHVATRWLAVTTGAVGLQAALFVRFSRATPLACNRHKKIGP